MPLLSSFGPYNFIRNFLFVNWNNSFLPFHVRICRFSAVVAAAPAPRIQPLFSCMHTKWPRLRLARVVRVRESWLGFSRLAYITDIIRRYIILS